jgi:hypothetical protein
LLGEAKQGVYLDDTFRGVHASLISEYYGINGQPIKRRRGGAGSTPNDPDVDVPYEAETLANTHEIPDTIAAHSENVRHLAATPASSRNPFENQKHCDDFIQLLQEIRQEGIIPDVMDGHDWDPSGELKVGKSTHQMTLPRPIWEPRAVLWCQGVELMTRMLNKLR